MTNDDAKTSDLCGKCFGRGWYPETVKGTEEDYIPDYREAYCDCERGDLSRKRDGAQPRALTKLDGG